MEIRLSKAKTPATFDSIHLQILLSIMRLLIYPILLLLALLCMSCAKTIIVDLQHSSPNTGSIVIAPTSPIIRSAVTLY